MATAAEHPSLQLALDFASNWEIRGGVWRYGIEVTRALVNLLGAASVRVPCYDRLPEARVTELQQTGARVDAASWSRWYDRLESMAKRSGRYIPWKTVLPWVYGPRLKEWHFQSALPEVDVYHAIFTCRGRPRNGVTVGMIHDLIPYHYPHDAGLTRERFLEVVADHRRWAELVIVPSESTKRDLVEHLQYPAEQIRVVYHGIDQQQFHPGVVVPEQLLQQHGLQPGQYLLYVGALERRKNIERLVEAYLDAVGDRNTAPLVLAGAVVHDLPRLLAALQDGTGRVRHLGYVEDRDLPGLYRSARALVHVALAEGFGFTPLESMACGTPVISTRQTATGEVVGKAGLLVDAGNTAEIASAIRRILMENDLHAELRDAGLARVKPFTWEACARQTYAVYQEAHQRLEVAMKLGFYTPNFPGISQDGGIGSYTQTVARALVQEGHDVHVLTPGTGPATIEEGVHLHQVPVRSIPLLERFFPGLGGCWHISQHMKQIVRQYRLDLVEFPNWEGMGLLYQRSRLTPTVVRLHTSSQETQHIDQLPRTRLLDWDIKREHWSAQRADLLITHSAAHRHTMAEELGIAPERIEIITHGVPVFPDFVRSPRQPGPYRIVFLGRLEKRKGTLELLEAFPQVLNQHPNTRLMMIGMDRAHCPPASGSTTLRTHADWMQAELPASVREKITLAGRLPQEEVDHHLKTADVFVAPSRYESFGLIFPETMSWAHPVIGTSVGGIPEIIEHDVTGLLVPPESPTALAAAMNRLLGDESLRQRLGTAGRKQVEANFSASSMSQQVVAKFEQLLASQAKRF